VSKGSLIRKFILLFFLKLPIRSKQNLVNLITKTILIQMEAFKCTTKCSNFATKQRPTNLNYIFCFVCFVCHGAIFGTFHSLVAFLLPLESSLQGKVHKFCFVAFHFMAKKILNLEVLVSKKNESPFNYYFDYGSNIWITSVHHKLSYLFCLFVMV